MKAQLAERFREVIGDHPMTAADDAYVSAQFVVLAELCARQGRDVDEVRRLMLEQRLPLPGYLRSDGAEWDAYLSGPALGQPGQHSAQGSSDDGHQRRALRARSRCGGVAGAGR